MVRFESRGSWLIYEITGAPGDDSRDQNTKKLFQKVDRTGTVVPVACKHGYVFFDFKLIKSRQTRKSLQSNHKVGRFELVCSKVGLGIAIWR